MGLEETGWGWNAVLDRVISMVTLEWFLNEVKEKAPRPSVSVLKDPEIAMCLGMLSNSSSFMA